MSNSHFVYFIRPVGRDGPIKIGVSRDPTARVEGLMCWSPFQLEILATVPGDGKLERTLHGLFAKSHEHHEWFRETPRLLRLIADLRAGVPLEQAIDLSGPREGKIRKDGGQSWSDAQRLRQSYIIRFGNLRRKHRLVASPDICALYERVGVNDYMPSPTERRLLDNALAELGKRLGSAA